MATEKIGTWKPSWVPRLGKGLRHIAVFVIVVVGVLLGVLKDTPVSDQILEFLRHSPPWALWKILLPSIAVIFLISALLIWYMQVWDNRRIDEAETQLKAYADQKTNSEKELHKKELELENLQRVFHERERMRRLDHITGIPNYLSWKDDMKTWDTTEDKTFSLILIDIANLKWLNVRSRECADKVLRYFAQNTYNSMRRDEQIYKAMANSESNGNTVRSHRPAEMYRHYQGGDEFFFIISGNVYDAIGFSNRLAERVNSYQSDIRETILRRYLKEADAATFRLSFSGAIIPQTEPETALANAYAILDRAKGSKCRLFAVFDSSYEEPLVQRERLEKRKESVQNRIKRLSQNVENEDENTAETVADLRKQLRTMDININILRNAERLFTAQ
jgi:GGDEF domain-containing protein